ncbi:caspase family protein [Salinimicrobium soli]|uniref:caspase family protein n=1 Tax=Salinimicrobium soli TaxID=1254399 RepID=UPI003AAF6441
MKKLFLVLFFCSITSLAFAEKYAVIIAVGDYPAKTGWAPISSVNDVPLIKSSLQSQGFMEDNILVLKDAEATKQNILSTLNDLKNRISAGDIVVIHYSGHGQQIFDDNSEEIDGLDEAIVPYDAWVKYTYNYKGENHIRDDEIGNILANFRNKLGKDGQLLMLLDSCHSGSSTRGGKARGSRQAFVPDNWEKPSGETSKGSDMFEQVKINENAAPFVLISGASANELNYEYEGKGSLSYSFSKAMNELGSDFTYRQLYSKIAAVMNTISPRQTPTIEGDQDYKLFKGEYVKQQSYYPVVKMPRRDVLKIQAGKLHGIFEGTTVNILPAGTTKVKEGEILTSGTVLLSKFNEANIQLDKPLESSNEKDYWVFVSEKSYGDIGVNVFVDSKIADRGVVNEIEKFLKENNLGTLVKDAENSDVYISEENSSYTLNATNGLVEFAEGDRNRGAAGMEDLKEQLFKYAQGNYLKSLNMDNEDYEFSFRLLPVEYDVVTETYGDTLSPDAYRNDSGTFTVRPDVDHVVLEVTNKGNQPVYFSLIEINSKGEINPFLPNGNCNLNDNERQIQPGQTMLFRDCIFSFAPPYEKLMIKGFASPNPINFQSTISTRGAGQRAGNPNPLEQFLGQTYTQSRGQSSSKVAGKVDGYSTEMIYEIISNDE